MAEFDLNAWYRKYHRYPADHTITAPSELQDLLKDFKEWQQKKPECSGRGFCPLHGFVHYEY